MRCIVVVLATDDKQSSGKPRKKREPKKPFRIDFNQISDEKQFSKSKVHKQVYGVKWENLARVLI